MLKMTYETEAEIVFTASIEKGWHVYSTGLGDDGPISATFNINASSLVETVGKLQPVGKEISIYVKMFEMNVVLISQATRCSNVGACPMLYHIYSVLAYFLLLADLVYLEVN